MAVHSGSSLGFTVAIMAAIHASRSNVSAHSSAAVSPKTIRAYLPAQWTPRFLISVHMYAFFRR